MPGLTCFQAEAPAEVAALFPNTAKPITSESSAAAATSIANIDRKILELLQELIRRQLAKSEIPRARSQEPIAEKPAEEPRPESETDPQAGSETSKALSP